MITATQLQALLETIDKLPRPVLTIWARSDQPAGGGPGEAARVRVRQLVSELGDELGEQLEPVRKRVLDALGRPAGEGTSVIFAANFDQDVPEVLSYHFPVGLPIGTRELQAERRFGEPWVTPLRLAISESERVGIIDVHEHGVALYETFLGAIEHVMTISVPTVPGEHDRLQGSKPIHPAHVADRGGSSYDDAQDHREAWNHRFYADAAADLEPLIATREFDSLVLIGTPKTRHEFEEAIPSSLRDKIFATGPALPHQDAGPSEILAAVEDTLGEHLRELQLARMKQLSEHGTLGLPGCLDKLQRGQIERLFVPWNLDAEVYVDSETGYVGETAGQALARSTNQDTSDEDRVRSAPAREELVRLADAFGAEVEFTHTGATGSPFDQVQGVAGLLRWEDSNRKTG